MADSDPTSPQILGSLGEVLSQDPETGGDSEEPRLTLAVSCRSLAGGFSRLIKGKLCLCMTSQPVLSVADEDT